MAENIGKIFEQEIKASFPDDYFIERYKDDTAGFKGVANPADYRLYKYPFTFLIELKTHRGKSIPISKIRPNQIQGMYKAVKFMGVHGGFILNYRDYEETYYVSVQAMVDFIQNAKRKSIPIGWCRAYGERIEQTKKRVRFTYNLKKWLGGYYD